MCVVCFVFFSQTSSSTTWVKVLHNSSLNLNGFLLLNMSLKMCVGAIMQTEEAVARGSDKPEGTVEEHRWHAQCFQLSKHTPIRWGSLCSSLGKRLPAFKSDRGHFLHVFPLLSLSLSLSLSLLFCLSPTVLSLNKGEKVSFFFFYLVNQRRLLNFHNMWARWPQ